MNESKDSLSSFIESEDVSEHAELIGLQFDQVIKECHLGDQLNPLMKHVIYLLEQMDLMIKEKNELQNSLGAVEGQLQQFQFESRESKLERIKCQSEFEQIEESFRNENTELLNLISKLKEDNLKLRNLRNKETFEDDEKQFKQNIDGVENCTQGLLINEKKKLKSLQKEFDLKSESYDQIEKQLDQERKRVETLSKQIQRLKEENLILNQHIDFRHNEHEKQLELARELKDILAVTICDHLDEHQQNSSSAAANGGQHEPKSQDEYIEKQRNHLTQLQLIQKLVETLSVAIETMNTVENSKIDSIKFNDKLSEKLEQLEHEQRQQSNRLSSSLSNQNSTPVESPKYCSLESNCSTINRKSPKHLLNEPPQSKFTLSEIRNILLERNSLQSQVKYLEKQLFSSKKAQSASKANGDDPSKDPQSIKKDNFSTENFKLLAAETKKDKKLAKENENGTTKRKLNSPEPDFLPVQGPLPKEPDEKLYPNIRRNSSSSFLKFFPLLKINRNK